MHERLKAIMKPGVAYTWGTLMKLLGGKSSTTEHFFADAEAAGYLQEVKPIDGVNRSFRLNQ